MQRPHEDAEGHDHDTGTPSDRYGLHEGRDGQDRAPLLAGVPSSAPGQYDETDREVRGGAERGRGGLGQGQVATIVMGRSMESGEGQSNDAEALLDHWHHIRLRLREELGDTVFDSWLRPLDVMALEGTCVTMSVPTRFMREWVERNFADRLLAHWQQTVQRVDRVQILLNGSALPPASQSAEPPVNPMQGYQVRERASMIAPADPSLGAPFESATATARRDTPQEADPSRPRPAELARDGGARTTRAPSTLHSGKRSFMSYEGDTDTPLEDTNTFANFIVGKSNELAHAAARRVAESDVVPFNPLFLHGSTGLGKTHLMHAIAWHVRQRAPEKRVLYLSAEKFMYQFVAAIRHHNQFAFKEQFRTVDLLMIDDFQYISGKENTQEEFFHTFNTLVDRSRQIIISADRSPTDLEGVEERIRSRLSWGLVADIHPTDFELRLGILQLKARQAAEMYGDVNIPLDVLDFLAHKITSNIRELEGALQKLLAHAALVGRPVTVEVAQELLQHLIRANTRKVTVEEIQRKVAEHFSVKVADLLSPRRARSVTRPRQIAMYLSKQLTQRSLPDIGRRFGNRDHTTVMHAVRKIEELRRTDPSIDQAVETLRRLLER